MNTTPLLLQMLNNSMQNTKKQKQNPLKKKKRIAKQKQHWSNQCH